MVKKLLKHELYALFRVLIFFAIAVVVFGVLGRIVLAVEIKEAVDEMAVNAATLLIMFYMFAIFAFIIAAYALGISRFYKTLFTGEGYMTLSLPASPMQLIWAKLLSSLIGIAFAGAVSALTASIYFIGNDELATILQGVVWYFRFYFSLMVKLEGFSPFYVVEAVIALILSIPMWLLLVYSVICVGQMVTSHRKAATFGIFIGGAIAWNTLDEIVVSSILEQLAYNVSPHLSMLITIILYAAIDVGCFLLIRYILKNKVNLIA